MSCSITRTERSLMMRLSSSAVLGRSDTLMPATGSSSIRRSGVWISSMPISSQDRKSTRLPSTPLVRSRDDAIEQFSRLGALGPAHAGDGLVQHQEIGVLDQRHADLEP